MSRNENVNPIAVINYKSKMQFKVDFFGNLSINITYLATTKFKFTRYKIKI